MKKKSRIRAVFSAIFNVKYWLDFERVKAFFLYLLGGIKKVTIPKRVKVVDKTKSFTDTAEKLKLTAAQLQKRYLALYRYSLLMLTLCILLLSYGIYHLFYYNFLAALISVVLSGIALILAFRYHFWYFQIKEQKLGCTFSEWFNEGLLGREKSKLPRTTKD